MKSKVENYAQASETCNITETTAGVEDAAAENLTGQEHVMEEPESTSSKNNWVPIATTSSTTTFTKQLM